MTHKNFKNLTILYVWVDNMIRPVEIEGVTGIVSC